MRRAPRITGYRRRLINLKLGFVPIALILASAIPAEAQREFEPLFDKFSFTGELSWVGFNTEIGLYHQELETGGTLNFENDLNLGDRQAVPSLDFEWQIARRHRLAVRWQNLDRDRVPERHVNTPVNRGHSTLADHVMDFLSPQHPG